MNYQYLKPNIALRVTVESWLGYQNLTVIHQCQEINVSTTSLKTRSHNDL